MLDTKVSIGTLIIGALVAVFAGIILEVLFFSVDYSKCESLQYEDDEYYYYVKAVPKVGVPAPEKMVKRINKQKESEVFDSDELRKRNNRSLGSQQKPNSNQSRKNNPVYAAQGKNQSGAKGKKSMANTEHLLLTRSLRKDLNLDGKGK